MSMNIENNSNETKENTTPVIPGSEYRTAGQSMQPPILTPTTFSQPQFPKPEVASSVPQVAAPVVETAPKKEKKAKKEKSSNSLSISKKRFAAALVVFCLLGAALGTCGSILYGIKWSEDVRSEAVSAAKKAASKDSSKTSAKSAGKKNQSTVLEGERDYSVLNTKNVDTNEQHTAAEIYAANVNSTVGISTSINYNYYGYETTAAASGSGFILTEDGYIVTNYHVIEDANQITVTTYDGQSFDAKLIGFDISNDLAVLKIDAKGLTPVILGDSDKLNVGDEVIAIGNPLGELTFSLTKGYVSALNRTVTINNQPMNLIQTDCAINSGNSGGALFNMYGEVIGITNAKYSNNGQQQATIESIGFAIPISSVRDVIDSIVEKGYVSTPYIGVYAEKSTEKAYGSAKGVGIHDIIADSPAEKAGMKAGDVILEIDGEEVNEISELKTHIQKAGIGGSLKLKILRDGKEKEITVAVEETQSSSLG